MGRGTSSPLLLLLLLLLGNLVIVSSNPHRQKPDQPRSLMVLDKSGRTIEISWTHPYDGNSPITHYIVQYKHNQHDWDLDSDYLMVSGNQNKAVLSSLRPATRYYLRIVTRNAIGDSDPSDTVNVITSEEDDWDRDSDYLMVLENQNKAVLSSLRPATRYYLRIVARNGIGDSDPSDAVNVITSEEAPSGPPLDLRVEAVDQHSLNVTWKPPLRDEQNGGILGYYVAYRLAPSLTYDTVETTKERHLVIDDLSVFTQYAVNVNAFNKIGQGPTTKEVFAYTAEGIPQQPPQDVTCFTLSSQTIQVSWSSPSLESVQGVIKGYKVIYSYRPWGSRSNEASKYTTNETHLLHGLQKYTNYSLQVLAFTSGGEGVQSQPIHCQTDQDVPEAPTPIKALVMSAESILVSWQPPVHPNGIITQYTVYFKEHGKVDAEAEQKKLLASQLDYEVSGLEPNKAYVFWVTASTAVGEGELSHSVHLKLSDEAPAKISSFGQEIDGVYKKVSRLPCKAVGLPSPYIRWTFLGEPLNGTEHTQILPDGTLLLHDAPREFTGEYTCYAENPYGQDTITHSLNIQGPPLPPTITVWSTTTSSIEINLQPSYLDHTITIDGFIVYYKPDFSDWETVHVNSDIRNYILEGLWCGSQYVIFAKSFNNYGSGEPTEIVSTRTRGNTPVIPEPHHFFDVLIGTITLHLAAWQDGGCPLNYFVVEYKMRNQTEWTMESNQVRPTGNYVIMDLTPATRYNLRVTAHNNAGSSVAEYDFATLTLTGDPIPPLPDHDTASSSTLMVSVLRDIFSSVGLF